MLTENDLDPSQSLQDAMRLYKLQHALALKYEVLMLGVQENPPTEVYENLLNRYGLPFLPQVVMDGLEAEWRKDCSLHHTGRSLLHHGRLSYRANQ